MSKIFDKVCGAIPWVLDALFKALGIHDKTKRFLIVVLIIAVLEAPLAILQGINIYQRVKYQKDNPNRYPMSAPAAK